MQEILEIEEKDLILYRYFAAIKRNERGEVADTDLERMFLNCELKFTSPKNFNDPFDCKSFLFTLEGVKRGEAITWIQNTWVKSRFSGESSVKRREIAERMYEDFKSGKAEYIAEKISNEIYSKIQDDFLICCFSEIPDSILMWAHYATGHKGFCIKYRFVNKMYMTILNVTYPDNNYFPKINPVLYAKNEDDAVRKMVLTKSKHWDYEREWRMIKPNDENRYEQFPPEFIEGVIFGWKMEPKDEEQIRTWVKQGNVKPKYSQSIGQKDKFALDILPIK